jgi:hypothetical protein
LLFVIVYRDNEEGTIIRACELLKGFFLTKKDFLKKEEVKKMIDMNVVVSLCTSSNEGVADSAGCSLHDMECTFSSPPDEEEHPDFISMKEGGILMKMYSVFKECKIEKIKRLIGFVILNVDRGCYLGEKIIEVICWMRDNTSQSTEQWSRQNTLVNLRRVIYRLFLFLNSHYIYFDLIRLSRNDDEFKYPQIWDGISQVSSSLIYCVSLLFVIICRDNEEGTISRACEL